MLNIFVDDTDTEVNIIDIDDNRIISITMEGDKFVVDESLFINVEEMIVK